MGVNDFEIMYALFIFNTRRLPNVGTMLSQRCGRWANIVSTLGECFVFAGMVFNP